MSRRVRVKAGKHRGRTGVIRNSGHGYYCVEIEAIGNTMIRGFQLELLDEDLSDEDGDTEEAGEEAQEEEMSTEARLKSPRAVVGVWQNSENPTDNSADPCIGFAARVLVGMLSGMESVVVREPDHPLASSPSSCAASTATDTEAEEDERSEEEQGTYEIQTYDPQAFACPSTKDRKARFMVEVNTPHQRGASSFKDNSLPKFDWELSKAIRKNAVDLTSYAW